MSIRRPTFKPYYQDQLMTIPLTLDELVFNGHPVLGVNNVINRISIESLFQAYKIKGSFSYHPQMLLRF